jgi:hypothetical protein
VDGMSRGYRNGQWRMGRPVHLVRLMIPQSLSALFAVQGIISDRRHASVLPGFFVDTHFSKFIPDVPFSSGANPAPRGRLPQPCARRAGVVGSILSRERPNPRRWLVYLAHAPQPRRCWCRAVQQLRAQAELRADSRIRLFSAQCEPFHCFGHQWLDTAH